MVRPTVRSSLDPLTKTKTKCAWVVPVLGAESNHALAPSGIDLFSYTNERGGSIPGMLDWLAPFCAANATNWPWPMTRNPGESVAGELPRCRIIYSWAALLFPAKRDAYSSIAETASSAPASYFAPFMRSSADFTRLFFAKSDDVNAFLS
eukprot:SAG31_NODE_13031_length_898_cov_1.027534_1_plen_150_part_00